MKYNYFYKITNLTNNHFYYGIHSTNNLNDGYMGSGRRLHYAYKKYGIKNFTKEILKFFNTREECAKYEAEMVTEDLVKNDNCYNVKLGGEGWNTKGLTAVKDNDGNVFLISTEDVRFKNGELKSVNKNISVFLDEDGNTYCLDMRNPEDVALKKELNLHGRTKGKTSFIDENGNIYSLSVNDPLVLSGKVHGVTYGKKFYHTDETKKKLSESHKGEKNSQFNKIWIHKDAISKSIKKSYLEEYLNDGWSLGKSDELKKKNELSSEIIKQREQLVLKSNIDFSKEGWAKKLDELLQIHHSPQFLKKYMPDFYNSIPYKKVRNKK